MCIYLSSSSNKVFTFWAQVTQQVYVVEEWAKKAREDLHREVQSRSAAERTAGDLKQDFDCLNDEVKEVKKAHASAEAGLKNATKQADDLCIQLRQSEEKLTTERQAVSALNAEVAKIKEEARLAREAAEKAVAASFDRGVRDTEVRLTKEVAAVCRDYIIMSWGVALDRAAVPADSDLWKVENIFFPKDIREIPNEVASEEPLPTDSSIPEAGGTQQATQGKLPEDSLCINELIAQVKETAPGPQAADDQPAPVQGS